MTEQLTVRELVRRLGGATQVGKAIGVSSEAVCNWYTAGIPRSRHVQLWTLCRARGIAWQPPGADALLAQPPAPPVAESEARKAA